METALGSAKRGMMWLLGEYESSKICGAAPWTWPVGERVMYREPMQILSALILVLPQLPITDVLDDFHLAAAEADGARYFAHFTDDAVFLGTDAGERWSLDDFREYASPFFAKGQGWTYVASERNVSMAAGGQMAWFDERLQNEKYGEVRGSGVLELDGAEWKIAQYSLSFPVPNDLAKDVVKKIAASEQTGPVRAEEWVVEDGERSLFIWNKVVPAQLELNAEERPAVLLLPSASFSARASWDFPLRDYSAMNALARRGFDVFAVELGGYGLSSPPAGGGPGGCASAVQDLALMVNTILERRGLSQVVIVGHSWGSQVAGSYAMEHPDKVRGLVLYGFTWKEKLDEDLLRLAYGDEAFEGPFRPVTDEIARGDFRPGNHEEDVPSAFSRHLRSQGKWVPSGALHDYASKLPLVDPARLRMPTLMLYGRGEWDSNGRRASQRAFYAELPASKHWMEIPGGDHSVHLDNPHRLFQRCLAGWIGNL